MSRVSAHNVEHIGIVGAGTIGASWASYFLARGYQVTATDPAPGFERYVRNYIQNAWPALEALDMVTERGSPDRIIIAREATALREVQFIQESVPERLGLKQHVYAEIEPVIAPETIIASSASGLMVSELQSHAVHPERFALAHPFNPPHLIPLVEVVGGQQTDPAVVDWVLDFYNGCGKEAIRINKEVPGHVANRLQAAIWREAIHLVVDGVASVADVDRAIASGPGLRWAIFGPHMTFQLGSGGSGMDVFIERYKESFHRWWADLGDPQLSAEIGQLLATGLEEEAAGRSFAQLAAERDLKLVALLKVLKQFNTDK